MKSFRKRAARHPIVQGGVGLLAITSVSLAAMAAQGALRVFYVNDPVGRNVISIMSDAPLETMLTRTNQVTAELHVNPANVLDNPKATFVVDTASLDTGIKARDEHMRSAQWLDTAKYPKATFTLTKVLSPTDVVPLQTGKTMNGEVEGTLSVHGITKPVRAKVTIRTLAESEQTKARLSGELLHVRATFPLRLSEFGINVPPPAQLKIAEEQLVTVDVYSSTGSPKPGDELATTPPATTRPAATNQAATTQPARN